MQNKITIALIIVALIAAVGGALFFFSREKTISTREDAAAGAKVISENLTLPHTVSVGAAEGRMVSAGAVAVPLAPANDGERVIVPNAVLTVKGVYALAQPEARKWSADAKLVFIKSLGAITLEGKSSQWQAVFDSEIRKKGYEIIARGGDIVSQKKIDSTAVGADLPKNWNDSDTAVKSLQELPQYGNASISAINFFYNTDAREWRYGFSTSIGSASMRLR